MKCPHCIKEIHAISEVIPLQADSEGTYFIEKKKCTNPACLRWIIFLVRADQHQGQGQDYDLFGNMISRRLVHPKGSTRTPAPDVVPEVFKQDYFEACLVLDDSPKASAALSRRCLQNLLRDKAKVKHGSLSSEIDEVLKSNSLPSFLSDNIDAIRNIGNFAAHPLKSDSSGEIVEVETGEAEWNLDVIESLFDFYFVQPAKMEGKRQALNEKLSDAGKPEMKGVNEKSTDEEDSTD